MGGSSKINDVNKEDGHIPAFTGNLDENGAFLGKGCRRRPI
jgi:hypothetical protein